MTKKWIAINLLLLAVAALLGWQLRKSIIEFDRENDIAKIQPGVSLKQRAAREKPLTGIEPPKNYDPAEFSVIPEKNLFSDSRSMETSTEGVFSPEPQPLTLKPILVGVTIMGSDRRASIIDPTSQQNRRAQIKRIGDVYQGYTIKEISADQIILENGTRREIIPLHEGTKRAQGGKTPILSTRIVPIGGGSIAGTTPVTVGGQTGAIARPQGSPATIQPGAAQSIVVQPGQTVVLPTARQPQAQAAPQPKTTPQMPARITPPVQMQTAPVGTDSQGRRVIRTPFGDILRPDR